MAVLIDILKADWSLAVSLDTIWETDVSVSRFGGVEERTCTVSRPRRSLNFQLLACGSDEVFRLIRLLKRSSDEQLFVPLAQDQAETEVPYDPGVDGTTLTVPTDEYRFYFDRQILVSNADGSVYEQAQILNVSAGSLALTAPLANSYPTGSRVFPLMEADFQFNQQAAGVLTDGVVQNQLTFREVIQETSLPPFTTANDLTGWTLFDGLPVLEADPNYAGNFRFELPRIGDQFASGQGRVSTLRSPFPRFSWSSPARWCSREEWSETLRFFSSRRGRLLPFYVVLPVSIYKVQRVQPGFVDVDPLIDIADIGFLPNLGLIGPTGESFITEIASIAQSPTFWRLSVAVDPPSGWDENTIRIASAGVLARFSRDSLREIWDTAGLPRATLEIVTLINEQDFATTIPGDDTGVPGGSNLLEDIVDVQSPSAGSNLLDGFNEGSPALAGSQVFLDTVDPLDPPGGGNLLYDQLP